MIIEFIQELFETVIIFFVDYLFTFQGGVLILLFMILSTLEKIAALIYYHNINQKLRNIDKKT